MTTNYKALENAIYLTIKGVGYKRITYDVIAADIPQRNRRVFNPQRLWFLSSLEKDIYFVIEPNEYESWNGYLFFYNKGNSAALHQRPISADDVVIDPQGGGRVAHKSRASSLSTLTVIELKRLASTHEIVGRSKLTNKAQLIAAITKAMRR
jgi:hypothetical protein